VGPRAGLDDVEKRKFLTLPGLELLTRGRPARSQSLYRLRYPGSYRGIIKGLIFRNHTDTRSFPHFFLRTPKELSG
jgi:hypothetical protein